MGARTAQEYLAKAESFAKTLDKSRALRYPVKGATSGVVRFVQGKHYIDLTPDGSIISFGSRE